MGRLHSMADQAGWSALMDDVSEPLSVIFGLCPYLARLAQSTPNLQAILHQPVQHTLDNVFTQIQSIGTGAPGIDQLMVDLRAMKRDVHLTLALGDLAGAIDLETVTRALSDFADAALQLTTKCLAQQALQKGRVQTVSDEYGLDGVFIIGMGKLGGHELNYSSDIDLIVAYDPRRLPLADGIDPQQFCTRFARDMAKVLQDQTVDGYVFRCDYRLRPDPASTPLAVSVPYALNYYETVGQNWERAAFIKARIVAGDPLAGDAFLQNLHPYIWRRSLDYVAVDDIRSLQKQVHARQDNPDLTIADADIKRGPGGIREIELYAQTQQLTLGGRFDRLKHRETCQTLRALGDLGFAEKAEVTTLTQSYETLRHLEHRLQMVGDEQTHTVPGDDTDRAVIAALVGYADVTDFDQQMTDLLRTVNAISSDLYPEAEDLSLPEGSLVFTGPNNSPETLKTLGRLGFENPRGVSTTIRQWHHGQIKAMRTARARALFTRLVPHLLRACAWTGLPDQAFAGFGMFFSNLNTGVQVISLLLNHPKLFSRLIQVFAISPVMAQSMAKQPQLLEGLIIAAPSSGGHSPDMAQAILSEQTFEGRINLARHIVGEARTRLEFNTLTGQYSPDDFRKYLTELADISVSTMAQAAWAEQLAQGGQFDGHFAVVTLGSQGASEMTSHSDLDILVIYDALDNARSDVKSWSAEETFSRFTKRLVSALSAPTEAGILFPVDMKLRPSGRSGPVAVHIASLKDYYQSDAWVWEHMALCRARVVAGSDAGFAGRVGQVIGDIICQPRDPQITKQAISKMRKTITDTHTGRGIWDVKYTDGGLIDTLFWLQAQQLLGAHDMPDLAVPNTQAVMAVLSERLPNMAPLQDAYRMHLHIRTVFGLARGVEWPEPPFKAALQEAILSATDMPDMQILENHLRALQAEVRRQYDQLFTW